MRQCMDSENLHRRLKKIIGQVQAIDRMVDEDVPCEDILSLISAAKSALNKAGQVVLEGHIKHCVKDGIEHGDADKTIENFTKGGRALRQHAVKAHPGKGRIPCRQSLWEERGLWPRKTALGPCPSSGSPRTTPGCF